MDQVTVVSTRDPWWEMRAYDEQSGAWATIKSGPVVIEITGDAPSTPASMRYGPDQWIANRGG